VFLLCHGLGDHSGHMMTVVKYFAPLGYKFYGFDMRGNGQSPGIRGHVNAWDELRDDLHAFIQFVKEKEPSLPLLLFGNSLGGLVSIEYLLDKEPTTVVAVIANGPALKFADMNSFMSGLLKGLSWIIPKIGIDVGLDSTKLTTDVELQVISK